MYILGINISHHASVCLLNDGIIEYYIEEERLSRNKYHLLEDNNNQLYSIKNIKKYTNHLNYIIFSSFGRVFNEDSEIIQSIIEQLEEHDILYDSYIFNHEDHHLYHAACGFYGSGFEDAVCLVLDGGGSYKKDDYENLKETYKHPFRETESIYSCDYQDGIKELYKHHSLLDWDEDNEDIGEILFTDKKFGYERIFSHSYSCGELFNFTSSVLGFDSGFDAGKVMGLSSYGNYLLPMLNESKEGSDLLLIFENEWFYNKNDEWITKRHIGSDIESHYEHEKQSILNYRECDLTIPFNQIHSLSSLFAYKLQIETEKHTLRLIEKAIKLSNKKNIILSGGYALNCVNNYRYRKSLPKDITIYIDPISNDAGTAIGAAKLLWHSLKKDNNKIDRLETLYLGK